MKRNPVYAWAVKVDGIMENIHFERSAARAAARSHKRRTAKKASVVRVKIVEIYTD